MNWYTEEIEILIKAKGSKPNALGVVKTEYDKTIHDLAIIKKKQLFIRFEGLLYQVDRSLYYPTFYCLDACLSFASTRIDEDV